MLGAAHSAEKAKRLVIVTTLGLMVFAGGEYVVYTHMTNVPITGRPHVVVSISLFIHCSMSQEKRN